MTNLGPAKDKTISFHVTNLTAADAQFLSQVIGVFCDPKQADQAKRVRAGDCLIQYGPEGVPYFAEVERDAPKAEEIIAFAARFNDDEWQDILRSVTNFRVVLAGSIADAEAIARRCLGYLPPERPLEPFHHG